jgi:hypothetical protein
METFKNTLGFIAAGLVLVVISTAQEPKASGPWVQGYGTLAPGGQHVEIWYSNADQKCIVSDFRRRDATGCVWVSASRVTMD